MSPLPRAFSLGEVIHVLRDALELVLYVTLASSHLDFAGWLGVFSGFFFCFG